MLYTLNYTVVLHANHISKLETNKKKTRKNVLHCNSRYKINICETILI